MLTYYLRDSAFSIPRSSSISNAIPGYRAGIPGVIQSPVGEGNDSSSLRVVSVCGWGGRAVDLFVRLLLNEKVNRNSCLVV